MNLSGGHASSPPAPRWTPTLHLCQAPGGSRCLPASLRPTPKPTARPSLLPPQTSGCTPVPPALAGPLPPTRRSTAAHGSPKPLNTLQASPLPWDEIWTAYPGPQARVLLEHPPCSKPSSRHTSAIEASGKFQDSGLCITTLGIWRALPKLLRAREKGPHLQLDPHGLCKEHCLCVYTERLLSLGPTDVGAGPFLRG